MTSIGIIGAGGVGSGLATVLTRAGHTVLLTNSEPGSARLADAATAAGATATDAASALSADIIVLALPYAAAVEFARSNADALAGKVVLDPTNPLNADYSELTVAGDTSAAEQIAAAAPGARVVKALNTVFTATYSNPGLLAAGVYVPVAGDDADAVAAVIDLVTSAGLDGVAVGGIETARFIEPTVMTLIHLGFFQGHGPNLGLRLVRA